LCSPDARDLWEDLKDLWEAPPECTNRTSTTRGSESGLSGQLKTRKSRNSPQKGRNH